MGAVTARKGRPAQFMFEPLAPSRTKALAQQWVLGQHGNCLGLGGRLILMKGLEAARHIVEFE